MTTTMSAEDRLVGTLNEAAVALMISVGHRAGLFDALARGAATSAELAERSGCDERYVREWLGALVTAGIAGHRPGDTAATAGYHLLDEYAELLTARAEVNFATFMQYVAVLGAAEDGIVECFRSGGGLGYEYFPRFHQVMAEESEQTVVAALHGAVVPLVDGLEERLASGLDVLDVGCGSGRALIELARRHPASRFVGVDLSPAAVDRARTAAAGLGHVRFVELDAAALGGVFGPATFDLVTSFDSIHDQADPRACLAAIREVLRPDGVYLAQDIAGSGDPTADREHPLGPFLYTISTMHCMTVSLAAGGEGWGAMWGVPMAQRELARAGFASVETHYLAGDVQNAWYVSRPSPVG